MGWLEKGQSAPFEHEPIDGMFCRDGDMLARRFNIPEARGYKHPAIAFPSGATCDLENSNMPDNAIVHIFGELDLSLKASYDEALAHVEKIAGLCGYVVRVVGNDGMEVFGKDIHEHVVIHYEAKDRRMSDVVLVYDNPADRPKPPLLDAKSRAALPPLYANEEKSAAAIAPVKFFTPDSNWTWYASEGSPIDEDGLIDTDKPKVDFLFFGLVNGFELEYGYFTLSELEATRGPLGLPIERDRFFEPKTLKELERMHTEERRRNS